MRKPMHDESTEQPGVRARRPLASRLSAPGSNCLVFGSPFRRYLSIVGVSLLVLAAGFACGDGDTDDDAGDLPNGSPAAEGENGGSELQERLEGLQRQFDGLDEETRSEIEDLWEQTQSAFVEWQSATGDQREELQEEFEQLAQELEERLDELGDDAGGTDDNGDAE